MRTGTDAVDSTSRRTSRARVTTAAQTTAAEPAPGRVPAQQRAGAFGAAGRVHRHRGAGRDGQLAGVRLDRGDRCGWQAHRVEPEPGERGPQPVGAVATPVRRYRHRQVFRWLAV